MKRIASVRESLFTGDASQLVVERFREAFSRDASGVWHFQYPPHLEHWPLAIEHFCIEYIEDVFQMSFSPKSS